MCLLSTWLKCSENSVLDCSVVSSAFFSSHIAHFFSCRMQLEVGFLCKKSIKSFINLMILFYFISIFVLFALG